MLTAWARILARVPNSRLIVLAERATTRSSARGPCLPNTAWPADRVEFVGKRTRGQYLQLHHHVDIALDTFPFNGHTTVCEALWMGVPVVVLAGDTYVTRFGGSALVNVGLSELIAGYGRGIRRSRRAAGRRRRTPAGAAGRAARAIGRLAATGWRGIYSQFGGGLPRYVDSVVLQARGWTIIAGSC